MSRRTSKFKQAQGIVSKCSSRIAKSGNYAHGFSIGDNKYTIFITDSLSPVTEGDRVRFDYEVRMLKSKYHTKYKAVAMETLIIEAPVELDIKIEGVVYILSNKSMPGLLKIGFTTGTATKRAEELSRVTSVPTGFKVEWTLPVYGDPKAVEQCAHAHLENKRHGKEFFKVPLDVAKVACINSFAKLYPEQASLMDEAFSTRAENELKRREDIDRAAAEREREKTEEQDRRAYQRSREGVWRARGFCQVVVNDFESEPNRGNPSLIHKLFGSKFEDFIEFIVKPIQRKDIVEWSISVSGRKFERHIGEYKFFLTQDECLQYVSSTIQQYGVSNYRTIIDIPNCLIENPPALPENYLNPEITLRVDSISELIIRPQPIKPRKL